MVEMKPDKYKNIADCVNKDFYEAIISTMEEKQNL